MAARHAVNFLEELDGGFEPGTDDGEVIEFDNLFAVRASEAVESKTETLEFVEAAGYSRGFSEAQASVANKYEALLKEKTEAFEAQLAAERAQWVERSADQSVHLIKEEIQRCETAIGEQVARLLLPLIETQLAEQSVREIRDLVRRLLAEAPEAHMKISGPGGMVEAMRMALGENGLHASVQESDVLELRVEIDQVVIESRVSKWVERLREAIG